MKFILLFLIGCALLLVAGLVLLPLLVAGFALLLPLLLAAAGIFAMIFWIWMLIDCIRNPGLSETEKIVWVLAIVFTHFIGAAIYFFAGRGRSRLSAYARPVQ